MWIKLSPKQYQETSQQTLSRWLMLHFQRAFQCWSPKIRTSKQTRKVSLLKYSFNNSCNFHIASSKSFRNFLEESNRLIRLFPDISKSKYLTHGARVRLAYTEPRKKVGTWLRDIASWPCLAFLPGPAWL